jgi:hypothetical protein
MPNRERVVNRLKEIMDRYRNIRRRLQKEESTVANRMMMRRFRRESLEELETLIQRL